MKACKFLLVIAAALVAVVAYAAWRRSVRTGEPFGVCLEQVVAEWGGSALYERARQALADGLRAASVREQEVEEDLAAAGAPSAPAA